MLVENENPDFVVTDSALMMLGIFDEVVFRNSFLMCNFVNLINSILVNLKVFQKSENEKIKNEAKNNFNSLKEFLCNSQSLNQVSNNDFLKNSENYAYFSYSEFYSELSELDSKFLKIYFKQEKFELMLRLFRLRDPQVSMRLLYTISNLVKVKDLEIFLYRKIFFDEILSCLAFLK